MVYAVLSKYYESLNFPLLEEIKGSKHDYPWDISRLFQWDRDNLQILSHHV